MLRTVLFVCSLTHMNMKQNNICIIIHKSLSNATRLDIIRILLKKPCNVSQMSRILGKRQPLISQHLRMLKDNNLIQVKIDRKYRIYSISRKYLTLLKQLTNIYEATSN